MKNQELINKELVNIFLVKLKNWFNKENIMMMILMGLFVSAFLPVGIGFIFEKWFTGFVAWCSSIFTTIVLSAFTIISAGHTGVQVTFGEVNMTPLSEGVHFVNPLSSIKDVDVRLQKVKLDAASAGTKDLQQVHTDIVVQYRLNASKVPHIYKEFGLNVDDKVLGPGINEAFKSITGHYTSEELITKHDEVSLAITEHLRSKMAPFNIDVSGVSLVNFGFSAEYQKVT
jgi:regulator of protease activity HflC (stomatin/prohibitin superfamily)